MSEAKTKRLFFLVLVALSVGLVTGLSFGDGASNHPTYLPPGLHSADGTFLEYDWWLNTSSHYHWAFSMMVAALAKIHFLEWGLALLNVILVGGSIIACWLIVRSIDEEFSFYFTVCIAAIIVVTHGLQSVAVTYLYSQGLQASTLATVATIFAIYFYINRMFFYAGFVLAVGGAFHFNFLVLNLCLFGLSACVYEFYTNAWGGIFSKKFIRNMCLLGIPSLIVFAFDLPLVYSILSPTISPENAALARNIFIDFAVPFHYKPTSYLYQFPVFLGWQLIGFAWVELLPMTNARLTSLRILQWVIFAMIWTATLLTTVVFIHPVSKLFVWRLAPFSLLIAIISMLVGVFYFIRFRHLYSWSNASIRICVTCIGLIPLLRFYLPLQPYKLLTIALPGFLGGIAFLYAFGWIRIQFIKKLFPAFSIVLLSACLFAFAASHAKCYNLILSDQTEVDAQDVFSFVKNSTPLDAQFVIPPNMDKFRLFASRAIVVDLKALPFDPAMLIEWYRRLEDISAVSNPVQMQDVVAGYRTMDVQRLEYLYQKYNANYVVLLSASSIGNNCWHEIYHNPTYRVLRRNCDE